MIGLTRRQSTMLNFIRAAAKKDGVVPSIDEIRDGMGLRSRGATHAMLLRLEERGAIRRLPNRARAIVLAKPGIVSVEIPQHAHDRAAKAARLAGLSLNEFVAAAVMRAAKETP